MSSFRQPLPADCLLAGRVHPDIAERLERIRQLPVAAVANYLGLQHDDAGFWLCWQETGLRPLDIAAGSREQHILILEQVRQIAVAMHAHGIVHGAIDTNSILLDPHGQVRLSRISALLYDDPQVDLLAIERLAEAMGLQSPVPASTGTFEIDRFRSRERTRAGLLVLIGALMFAGLLWYSQAQ